jgi:hypothetical protein
MDFNANELLHLKKEFWEWMQSKRSCVQNHLDFALIESIGHFKLSVNLIKKL